MSGLTKVRALFKVNSVTHLEMGNSQIKMSAIYGKEGENADFAAATPFGSFEMHINQDRPASQFFAPGDEIYLDFTKKPKPGTV